MSDVSSSSREGSPRPFRLATPGSDTESVAPTSWQASASTLHPSSHAPLLRQPVGFGAPAPAYHAQPSPSSSHFYPSFQGSPAENYSERSHKSYKGKAKDRSKEKTRDESRKGKERDKGSSRQAVAQPPHTQPYVLHPPPDPNKKAFRVRSYSNDWGAGGTPNAIQEGPYGATFRADVGERVSSSRPQTSASPPHHRDPRAQHAPAPQDPQPNPKYYPNRCNYDEIRRNTPANRAKQAAAAATAGSATAIPTASSRPDHSATRHRPYPTTAPALPSNPDNHHRSSRSKKRKDTHMYPPDYGYPPSDPYYGDTQDFSSDYPNPAPVPQFDHVPPTHSPSPAPAPSREKRHKSRSHRDERTHYPSPGPVTTQPYFPSPQHQPQPQPQTSYQQEAPPPSTRVCRVLTLLIEDRRNSGFGDDGDGMLTEVRVPLKNDGDDDGFWADAQDVTNELQNGPSRIDGRAKVYTLRGKYKQYFLRITADGEQVCQSANLKVALDRTLQIYVEDNPPPAGMTLAPPSSPPRLDRELLTPITDSMSMTSPSPAPMSSLVSGHKRPSHSSLFSAEDYPSPEETKYDSSPKKRPRSASIQSVQSTRSVASEGYLQPQLQSHDAFSPFSSRRTPSVTSTTTAAQPRISSQPSPPPQRTQPPEPPQMSPTSPSSDLPPVQPQRPQPHPHPVQSVKVSSSFSFPSMHSSASSSSSPSTISSSTFTPGPSPPKKMKLSAPRHTEHSVSPGPSEPGTYPWSHSRGSSMSKSNEPSAPGPASTPASTSSSMSGFAAYANIGAKKTLTSTSSTSISNPFARYDTGPFSLPTPQSQPSSTASSQGNLALPSAPGMFTTSSLAMGMSMPSLSSVSMSSAPPPAPTTMAPSAMTVTPTLFGQALSDLDNAIGKWIRAIIDKEPEWSTFVENRKKVLTVREQLEQYRYVQRILDRFTNTSTPADLEGAGGVTITKAQVMRAFNLPLAWGEQCTETLLLTGMYGPNGARDENERVVRMLDEPPAITTKITTERYLNVLKEVHQQWMMKSPG